MAETLRPESEERLESYLCDQLNYNQLSKGIRSLKLLNLIVEKKSNAQNELLELHPLIKTYIISHFPKKERSKYISLITVFIDKTIQKCRKEISKRASFAMLEYWVMRTELAVNAGYLEDALINISEVGDALCSSGHSIEFIRVCCDLFDEIQFVDAVMNEYKEFDEVFHLFVDNLALNGRFDDADVYLERYKSAISGKSARYINYCNLLCYVNWCKKDFSLAVYWGQIGSELKQKHNLDTRFDCEHNLALSRRDNGEIDLALIYFMSGSTFEDVVNPDIISKEKGGHYYGNIGRCLWFNKDIQNAITCYKKALKLLDDYDDESYDNRGWGCYWSAEALEMEEKVLIAYCLYLKAKKLWEKVSPPKAVMAEDRANILYASNIKHINRPNIDDIQIERNYQAWLISSG
jgi:tetratricopeptide (TPR) repeat protein